MQTSTATEPAKLNRATINRANAQHSTGPRTLAGKARASSNSFRHGLYSKQLIIPGEDPAEFDHLRATLRIEHQPANTTEEILVDELAQHFWRMRRFRELEARAWTPENLDSWFESGLLTLIQRSMASAERAFHRSLAALRLLQRDRASEIMPAVKSADPDVASESTEHTTAIGLGLPLPRFVPAKAARAPKQDKPDRLLAPLPNPNRKAA